MIYELLTEQGQTAAELMEKLDIKNLRAFQNQVRTERLDHKPILTDGRVYFISDDRATHIRCNRTLYRRALHTLEVAKALKEMTPDGEEYDQLTVESFLEKVVTE